MASSQNHPPGCQQDLPVTPSIPPYIHISVQLYLPRVVTLTRGTIEVLWRQTVLLDNLGVDVGVGHQHQGTQDKRGHSLNGRRKRIPSLPPQPDNSRYIRARLDYDHRGSSRHREGLHNLSRHREDNHISDSKRE